MTNRLKMIYIVCALATSFTQQADAMHEKSADTLFDTNVTCGFGFIVPGVMWADIDNVNDYLASQGISRFKSVTPTLSFGGHREMKRLVFESVVTLRYWRDRVNENLRSTFFACDMVGNHGINVMPETLPVIVFPYFGFGVGFASMYFRSKTKKLEQLLASSEPDAMLWQAAFLLNAGGGADFLLFKKGSEKGMAIGIRAGYLFDPFSGNEDRDWWSGGTRIDDAPLFKQNGPYLRLILGGW